MKTLLFLLAMVLPLVLLFSGCAGYTVGGGLGYTDEQGRRYDANVTVERDPKTVKRP